jgi:23S rRNA (pseudouridine1915-N3)-methyltransferase
MSTTTEPSVVPVTIDAPFDVPKAGAARWPHVSPLTLLRCVVLFALAPRGLPSSFDHRRNNWNEPRDANASRHVWQGRAPAYNLLLHPKMRPAAISLPRPQPAEKYFATFFKGEQSLTPNVGATGNRNAGRLLPSPDTISNSPMHLIAVGRMRAGPDADLFARYNARLRPPMSVIEIPEGSGAPAEVKRREGAVILAALPANAFAIALDLGGEMPDSVRFSGMLERWLGTSRKVCFLIGGAEGLDCPVLDRSDVALSLGPMTWPHFMVRAMLAEQVYRARSIASGHPYHRAGRP